MTAPSSTSAEDLDGPRDLDTAAPELAELGLDELLGTLLDRVRGRLAVDTAAVLLLDRAGRFLTASAARGIEAEVYQGVRIPVGSGFAGRVAAGREPVVVPDLDEVSVVNPLLRTTGIHSLLGVPLLVGSDLLGVLHVGTLARREFGPPEVRQLQRMAARIAVAVRTRSDQADRAAVTALHRSLWPEQLPDVPELEFAARYVPGGDGETGGDWYDVFTVPSGATWIVMGDVAGRGLPAALAMGRLRSAVRAYAMLAGGPAELLRQVSNHVRQFDPGVMATVLCAVLEPEGPRLHLSSAGHPPPVVSASPDLPAAVIGMPIDLPVGVDRDRPRHTTDLALPAGAAVCFYTDGLVERRERSVAGGIERLRQAVYAGPAEPVCAAVMAALVGTEPATDDVAVLVVRRTSDPSGPLTVRRPAVPGELRPLRQAVTRWLVAAGASRRVVMDVVLAVGEAATNVVEHAYGPRGGDVDVRLELDGEQIVATVADSGAWRPARGSNRGRGLTMMRGLVDEVSVVHGGGTMVRLRTARRGDAA